MTPHERSIYEALIKRGYRVLRNGWPDFLVTNPAQTHGFALELKKGYDPVRPDQEKMHRALAKFGILTLTVRDDIEKLFRTKGTLLLTQSDLDNLRLNLAQQERRMREYQSQLEQQRKALDAATVMFASAEPVPLGDTPTDPIESAGHELAAAARRATHSRQEL